MDAEELQRLRAACASVLPAEPVWWAYLFGSRANGRVRPDSDVDVGVYGDPALSSRQRFDLAMSLGIGLRDAGAPGVLDVVVLNDLKLRFLGRVLRRRVVLYSTDEPARLRWESLTARMADDVELWARPMDHELLAAIGRGER